MVKGKGKESLREHAIWAWMGEEKYGRQGVGKERGHKSLEGNGDW